MKLDYYHSDKSPIGRYTLLENVEWSTEVRPEDYGYSGVSSDPYSYFGIVPSCFVTDFASVPRMFWSIIPPIGLHSRAALVHDYLYSMHPAGRPWADAVFYDIMKQDGVGFFTRWICYLAVRIFGRRPWDGQ